MAVASKASWITIVETKRISILIGLPYLKVYVHSLPWSLLASNSSDYTSIIVLRIRPKAKMNDPTMTKI
jgi:hypothetical protein